MRAIWILSGALVGFGCGYVWDSKPAPFISEAMELYRSKEGSAPHLSENAQDRAPDEPESIPGIYSSSERAMIRRIEDHPLDLLTSAASERRRAIDAAISAPFDPVQTNASEDEARDRKLRQRTRLQATVGKSRYWLAKTTIDPEQNAPGRTRIPVVLVLCGESGGQERDYYLQQFITGSIDSIKTVSITHPHGIRHSGGTDFELSERRIDAISATDDTVLAIPLPPVAGTLDYMTIEELKWHKGPRILWQPITRQELEHELRGIGKELAYGCLRE